MSVLRVLGRVVVLIGVVVLVASGACSSNTDDTVDDGTSTVPPHGTQNTKGTLVNGEGGLSGSNNLTGFGGNFDQSKQSTLSSGVGGQTQGNALSTYLGTGGVISGTNSSELGAGGLVAGTTPVNTGGTTMGRGMTLYYIRHAQVVANTLKPEELTYENSETLTEFGQQQVETLTTYLNKMKVTPDAVIVSPHRRTQNTIEPYLAANGLTGTVWMELAECCTQTPTGAVLPTTPAYSLLKASLEAKELTFREPTKNQFWQNETYESGLFMVMTAKQMLIDHFGQSGKTVFAVGHASAGIVLIGLLRGEDLTKGPTTSGSNAVYLLNTGITRLIQDPATGLFRVDGMNINNPLTK